LTSRRSGSGVLRALTTGFGGSAGALDFARFRDFPLIAKPSSYFFMTKRTTSKAPSYMMYNGTAINVFV
jgi:hypothetical protein